MLGDKDLLREAMAREERLARETSDIERSQMHDQMAMVYRAQLRTVDRRNC